MKLKQTIIGIVWLLLLVSFAAAWGGIPPNPLVFYGSATVNGTNVQIGDNITIHEIGDSDEYLAGGIVSIAGSYPAINIPWDNPDTGPDEGLTYSYAANIAFKINGAWVEYLSEESGVISTAWSNPRAYAAVSDGLEGIPTVINLTGYPNFDPTIIVDDEFVVTQGQLLTISVNATDDTTYENSTLTISQSGSPTFAITQSIYNSLAQANATWTPTCTQACTENFTPTFTVTDDGRPALSDSKQINVSVINVNDAPSISDGSSDVLLFENREINLQTELSFSDCDICLGDTATFALIEELNPRNGTNITITDASAGTINFTSDLIGVYRYNFSVTDAAGLNDTALLTITVTSTELVVIKNIVATGYQAYTITVTLYNFNNDSADFDNLTLADPELDDNYTFALAYREDISYSSNVTLNGTGIVPFAIATVYDNKDGGIYYSNEPSVYVSEEGAACPPSSSSSSSGGGGGGGTSGSSGGSFCPDCPSCTVCEVCEEPETISVKPEPKNITPQILELTMNLKKKIITSTQELVAQITLHNPGKESILTQLTYLILDSGGKTVYQEKAKITVKTDYYIHKNFKEIGLKKGNYKLIFRSEYDGKRQEIKKGFTLTQSALVGTAFGWPTVTLNFECWGIPLLLFLIFTILIIAHYEKKRRSKEYWSHPEKKRRLKKKGFVVGLIGFILLLIYYFICRYWSKVKASLIYLFKFIGGVLSKLSKLVWVFIKTNLLWILIGVCLILIILLVLYRLKKRKSEKYYEEKKKKIRKKSLPNLTPRKSTFKKKLSIKLKEKFLRIRLGSTQVEVNILEKLRNLQKKYVVGPLILSLLLFGIYWGYKYRTEIWKNVVWLGGWSVKSVPKGINYLVTFVVAYLLWVVGVAALILLIVLVYFLLPGIKRWLNKISEKQRTKKTKITTRIKKKKVVKFSRLSAPTKIKKVSLSEKVSKLWGKLKNKLKRGFKLLTSFGRKSGKKTKEVFKRIKSFFKIIGLGVLDLTLNMGKNIKKKYVFIPLILNLILMVGYLVYKHKLAIGTFVLGVISKGSGFLFKSISSSAGISLGVLENLPNLITRWWIWIWFGVVIASGLVFLIIQLGKRKKKKEEIKKLSIKLDYLKELKAKEDISRKTQDSNKLKLLEEMYVNFKNETISIFLLVGLFVGLLFLEKGNLTGLAVNTAKSTNIGAIIGLNVVSILGVIGFLVFLFFKYKNKRKPKKRQNLDLSLNWVVRKNRKVEKKGENKSHNKKLKEIKLKKKELKENTRKSKETLSKENKKTPNKEKQLILLRKKKKIIEKYNQKIEEMYIHRKLTLAQYYQKKKEIDQMERKINQF